MDQQWVDNFTRGLKPEILAWYSTQGTEQKYRWLNEHYMRQQEQTQQQPIQQQPSQRQPAQGQQLNFAVLQVSNTSPPRFTEIQDGMRYHICLFAYTRMVDIISSARGVRTVLSYITTNLYLPQSQGELMHSKHPRVQKISEVLVQKIKQLSPVLVIDSRMSGIPEQHGEHVRQQWQGTHDDFNIRQQTIKINAFWIDYAEDCLSRFQRGQTNTVEVALSFFIVTHTFSHEIWHVIQTYLGYGRENTPPNASGGRRSRGTHDRTTEGESGEFGERVLFGGMLHLRPDNYEHGGYTFRGVQVGWPWIDGADGRSNRASVSSITKLAAADFQEERASESFLQKDPAVHPINAGLRSYYPPSTNECVPTPAGSNRDLREARNFARKFVRVA